MQLPRLRICLGRFLGYSCSTVSSMLSSGLDRSMRGLSGMCLCFMNYDRLWTIQGDGEASSSSKRAPCLTRQTTSICSKLKGAFSFHAKSDADFNMFRTSLPFRFLLESLSISSSVTEIPCSAVRSAFLSNLCQTFRLAPQSSPLNITVM